MPKDNTTIALTHLSLFSGIGGADLAAEWAGIKTIAHSEIDPYCANILEKNFPSTPNLGDIKQINKEVLFSATGKRTVDIISGGYPCQPFSVAGNRRGKADDRYLWPAMLAVIKDIRPKWVIGENVAGHITMGLDQTLFDLEGANYSTRTLVIPACAAGALHRRDRVFIIAHDNSRRCMDLSPEVYRGASGEVLCTESTQSSSLGDVSNSCGSGRDSWSNHWQKRPLRDDTERNNTKNNTKRQKWQHGTCPLCEVYSNAHSLGAQANESISERYAQNICDNCRSCSQLRDGQRFLFEPDVGRMVNGVPSKVDRQRIKALGNAIVPQQIYPIFEAIVQIERMLAGT
jgi:DNA (cytosine-5)-methyltransferase 1